MRYKLFASLVWLLCCAVGFSVNALAAPSTPTLYELQGRGVHVTYSTISVTGEPQLTYATPIQTTTFRGADVREERTELGLLVTVTTAFRPDVNFVTFSALIPDINLQTGPENFSTVGFITNHSTPLIAPANLKGPVQTYQTLRMHGKASLVYYLTPTTGISGTMSINTCAGTPLTAGCVSPFANAPIEIRDAGNNVIAKAATNVDGMFNVAVASGSYVVHVVTNGALPLCPDTKTDVLSNGKAIVDIRCTAIR